MPPDTVTLERHIEAAHERGAISRELPMPTAHVRAMSLGEGRATGEVLPGRSRRRSRPARRRALTKSFRTSPLTSCMPYGRVSCGMPDAARPDIDLHVCVEPGRARPASDANRGYRQRPVASQQGWCMPTPTGLAYSTLVNRGSGSGTSAGPTLSGALAGPGVWGGGVARSLAIGLPKLGLGRCNGQICWRHEAEFWA